MVLLGCVRTGITSKPLFLIHNRLRAPHSSLTIIRSSRRRNAVNQTAASAFYASPALNADETLLYVGWGGNALGAISLQNVVLPGTTSCAFAWVFGLDTAGDARWQSSPVVAASGAVYFATCDSRIHAVNGTTGA
jgi:hypothetical protein